MQSTPEELRQLIVDEDSYSAANVAHPASGVAVGPTVADGVAIGRAKVGGYPVMMIVSNFRTVAGTMTANDAYRIARAFDLARKEQRAVIAVANSGGVRLQQGTRPFASMMAIAAAIGRHKQAGLLYYCYLAHPTTGGVLASWAGLAAVNGAEPNALIAFTGPRVSELTTGRSIPAAECRAESLRDYGLIDDIYPETEIRARVVPLLCATSRARGQPSNCGTARFDGQRPWCAGTSVNAWRAVKATRESQRPSGREFISHLTDCTLLHGDGVGGGDDPAVIAAVARIGGLSAVVVAHDGTQRDGRLAPGTGVTVSGLRKGRRALALAGQLRLPLISIIDTPGAQLGVGPDLDVMAFEIARALEERGLARIGLVSVLLGQGGGGAALAFLPADRILAAENAWLAPLPPEGSSAVLRRSIDGAAEIAEAQHITSTDLYRLGVVDEIVSEEGAWMTRLVGRVADATAVVQRTPPGRRAEQRTRKLGAVARKARDDVNASRGSAEISSK